MKIILVKPHPPLEILNRACPLSENYRYSWEPVVLKIIAYILNKNYPEIQIEIRHLIELKDDYELLESISESSPDIVLFTEIDVLVTEVNRLAKEIKRLNSEITTIVGGKQTSLLRNGDKFPFKYIDYAFRGDGPNAIMEFLSMKIHNKSVVGIKGMVHVNKSGYVYGLDTFSERKYHDQIDNLEMRLLKVENYSLRDYIEKYQSHSSILTGQIRTAPIYTGTGCHFHCLFCQSPIEYGKLGKVFLSEPEKVAAEIYWLHKEFQVNNFFSLEPNLNLMNLTKIYRYLKKYGMDYAAISGFVRAGDIKIYENKGILKELVDRGLRILSIGLDIPLKTNDDVYEKSFTYQDMMDCLEICKNHGIIVLSTIVGDPKLTKEEFQGQLEMLKKFPIAEVDIRLAIALRNTKYYHDNINYLIFHPDQDERYFKRQNYRYQTIQYPGKITPEETYEIVNEFYQTFYFADSHVDYVEQMIRDHPDTIHYFQRLYRTKKNHNHYPKVEAYVC